MRFLFFLGKATQGNLFDQLVPIKGHTTEQGTYVKPHYARRRKKHEAPTERHQPRSGDVEAKRERSTKPEESDLFSGPKRRKIQARGKDQREKEAYRADSEQTEKGEKGKEPAPNWRQAAGKLLGTGLDYTRPFHDLTLPDIGVPPGTTKAQRRKLNAEAVHVLEFTEQHRRPLEPDQIEALARYSGRGGCGDSLNEFYTKDNLYLLGDYEDSEVAAIVPEEITLDDMLTAALEEYAANAQFNMQHSEVSNLDGEPVTIWDEDAGL